jgi:hypothetical protein
VQNIRHEATRLLLRVDPEKPSSDYANYRARRVAAEWSTAEINQPIRRPHHARLVD